MGYRITNRNPGQGFSVTTESKLSLTFKLSQFTETKLAVLRRQPPAAGFAGFRTPKRYQFGFQINSVPRVRSTFSKRDPNSLYYSV